MKISDRENIENTGQVKEKEKSSSRTYTPDFPSFIPNISSREQVCTSWNIESGSMAVWPFRPYC